MNKEKSKNEITIKSSTAEYLTYIASIGDKAQSFELRYENENIWLTQKMLAVLYGVDVKTINYHIKKIYADSELEKDATISNFKIVQNESGRNVEREVLHYNLQMIIAIGFKVDNQRAVQFRKWANQIVKDYTIKGFAMNDERFKKGGVFTDKYFDEQLERIREIRLSERKFYQKITDLYATAFDYDLSAKTTKEFFAKVQNKLHFSVHGQTAPEIIYNRADSKKENMGLTTWQDAPKGKIIKSDTTIAKNYLSADELKALSLIVNGYLDFAEQYAKRKVPLSMEDWAKHLDRILSANGHELLTNAGSISAEIAKRHAESEFEKYRVIQDRKFMSDYDKYIEELLSRVDTSL
ncbi:MAG: virulence RhuM family protein [Clostridiales bacterium]|jgi:hypothetical protein|nr:virulence RhuM family protein [Clostridiales bacterium]